MATNFNDMFGSITTGANASVKVTLIVLGAIIGIAVLGGLVYYVFFLKKKWNLRVEFKLPRSDGKFISAEWGKGLFDSKRGVVFLKRKKIKAVPMKVFDIRKYLQGTDVLTVIQVGPEDYRPVLLDSFTKHIVEYVNDDTGEIKKVRESILNLKVDSGINKAWKSAFDISAKKAYSLHSFFQQFQTPITIAIVMVAIFVGFAIIWNRLPTICK